MIRIAMDKAGRIVVPIQVRKDLRLTPGDEFELHSSPEEIVLRPVRMTPPLKRERGVWVFRTGQPLDNATVEDAVQSDREERSREVSGGH